MMCIWAFGLTAVIQWTAVEEFGPKELADGLDAAANVLLNYDFDTTFEFRVLKAAADQSSSDSEDWAYLEVFRYVAFEDKLYILRDVYKRSEGEPKVRVRQENIWANGAWSHRSLGDNKVSFYAQPRPTDLHSKGFIFNSIEGRYPSTATLAGLVRNGAPLSQSVADGVLSYRFAADTSTASRVQYTIRAQLEPTLALLGYTVVHSDSPTLEDFQEHVRIRQTYTVVEWKQVGDVRIPWKAEIETIGSAVHPDAPRVPAWSIYTRQSFRKLGPNDVDPELFSVKLPVGTGVYDDRYKLSFEIGNKYIVLDGTSYELDQPVTEHPGSRLAELIQHARPHHPPEGSLSSAAPAASPGRNWGKWFGSPIGLAGLVALACALLTLALIRSRSPRRKAL